MVPRTKPTSANSTIVETEHGTSQNISFSEEILVDTKLRAIQRSSCTHFINKQAQSLASFNFQFMSRRNPQLELGGVMLITSTNLQERGTRKETRTEAHAITPRTIPRKDARGAWYLDFPISEPTRRVEAEESSV